MHELGIARDVCRAAADHAGGRKIKYLKVEVGALAGVAADALDFCIREVAREMGLGEPEVVIETAPAEVECACGERYSTTDMLEPCPSCGEYRREVASGMDIVIREIVLEEDSNG